MVIRKDLWHNVTYKGMFSLPAGGMQQAAKGCAQAAERALQPGSAPSVQSAQAAGHARPGPFSQMQPPSFRRGGAGGVQQQQPPPRPLGRAPFAAGPPGASQAALAPPHAPPHAQDPAPATMAPPPPPAHSHGPLHARVMGCQRAPGGGPGPGGPGSVRAGARRRLTASGLLAMGIPGVVIGIEGQWLRLKPGCRLPSAPAPAATGEQ